jgi:hypothetical protein
MGPKKKDGKAAAGEAVEGEDPLQFLQNYQKYCRLVPWFVMAFRR